ncbi:MAG: tetratricopeptide repeat protein [Acidobacteriota bacterium]
MTRLPRDSTPFCLGDWTVDPTGGTLRRGKTVRRLRPQEMELLKVLVAREGQVVTREELLDAVWGEIAVEESALSRCVSLIRKGLGDRVRRPLYIETVPKRGYRLIAEVGPAPSVDESELPAADKSSPVVGPKRRVPSDPSRRRGVAMLVAAVVLAIVGARWIATVLPSASSGSASAASESEVPVALPTLVVPAFRNLAEVPEHDWLSEGLAEMLATELAFSPRIHLVPRELLYLREWEGYGGTEARGLGADWILRGAFLLEDRDGTVRLDLKLVNANTERMFAVPTQAGARKDLAILVGEAGRAARRSLAQVLAGEGAALAEDGSVPTPASDPGAVRLYVEAMALLGSYRPKEARDTLGDALAKAPNQPFMQLALADSWRSLGRQEDAVAAADGARSSAEALPRHQRLWVEARAQGMASRWIEAAALYRELWDAYPGNLEFGLDLVGALRGARDFPAALEALAEVRGRAEPHAVDPRVDYEEASTARLMGEHQRAAEAARRALARSVGPEPSRLTARATLIVAQSLYAMDQPAEAAEQMDLAMESFRRLGDRRSLAWAQASRGNWRYHEGRLDEAAEQLEESIASFEDLGDQLGVSVATRHLAQVWLAQGHSDQAFEVLEECLEFARRTNDLFEQAQHLNAIGIAHNQLGRPEEAIAAYSEAHVLYRRSGNREMEAITLYNVATVIQSRGRIADAAERFRQAAISFRHLENDYALATVQHALALVARYEGNLSEAEAAVQGTESFARRVGNHRLLAQALIGRLTFQIERGRWQEARQILAEVDDVLAQLGDAGYRAEGLRFRYQLQLAAGEFVEAEEAVRRALDFAREHDLPTDLAYDALASALVAQGRVEEAAAALARSGSLEGRGFDPLERRLLAARIASADGRPEDARNLLAGVQQFATEGGNWLLRIQAEAALAELDLRGSEDQEARQRLAALEDQAREKGFTSLAARIAGWAEKRVGRRKTPRRRTASLTISGGPSVRRSPDRGSDDLPPA